MRLPRGETLRKVWIIASVLYAAARAVAFDIFLGQYGVKGEIYFLVEVLTAVPFAHYSAELVKAIHRKSQRTRALIATTAFYVAPDLYLIIEAREAPLHIYITTLAVILVLAVLSLVSLFRQIGSSDRQLD